MRATIECIAETAAFLYRSSKILFLLVFLRIALRRNESGVGTASYYGVYANHGEIYPGFLRVTQ